MILHQKRRRTIICTAAFTGLFLLSIAKVIFVKESTIKEYYSAKESRQGAIKRAKDKKKTIQFRQEREGVTRRIWLDDKFLLLRRQFFVEADFADISVELQHKQLITIEHFHKPKGWFQEELFWIIESTSARVEPIMNKTTSFFSLSHTSQINWVYQGTSSQFVEKELVTQIIPMQRLRYFDAASGIWDLTTNTLVVDVASFCITECPGHEPVTLINPNYIVMNGIADTLTFFLAAKPGEHAIASTGLKMQLGSQPLHLDGE